MIGVIAVLAAVVLVVLNPVETQQRAKDSNRIAEIKSLEKAVQVLITNYPAYRKNAYDAGKALRQRSWDPFLRSLERG